MSRFHVLIVSSVVLYSVAFTGTQPIESSERTKFKLHKVYEFKPKYWKEWPHAALDLNGETIYLLQASEVQVIDWKTGRTVGSASFANLPCESAVGLQGWDFVPGRPDILASYCGSLFLVDRERLQIKKQLLRAPPDNLNGLAVSPDGRWVAVSAYSPTELEPKHSISLFNTANWEVVQKWPVHARALSFGSDGKLLAMGRTRADEQKQVIACGIEVRHIPSGEVYAEWWRDKQDICFRDPVFVPGDTNSLVTLASSDSEFIVWDVKQGTIAKRITSERPISGFLISPDGTWLMANVSNDPEDTPEYNQDFVVWDLSSGAVLYESPRIKWSPLARLIDSWSQAALQFNDLSSNGKYLLATRYKRLVVYEVIFRTGE